MLTNIKESCLSLWDYAISALLCKPALHYHELLLLSHNTIMEEYS